jgi:hypothetical protein
MKLTLDFIYWTIGVIAVYDIIAVIIQNKKVGKKLGWVTITSIVRRWFKMAPYFPFSVGLVFIGHFGLYEYMHFIPKKISIIIFLSILIPISIWFAIGHFKKTKSKAYQLMCDWWPIPMTIGIIVGSFWA